MREKFDIRCVELDVAMKNIEVKFLRGAVIKLMDDGNGSLLHNHLDDNGAVRYSYPMVQYKRIGGNGAVVFIKDAVDIVPEFVRKFGGELAIGNRMVSGCGYKIKASHFEAKSSSSGFKYKISRWQPLDSENYSVYKGLLALTDKIVFLEKIMVGNILALYRGLGVEIDEEVVCNFVKMSEPTEEMYKGHKTLVFDLEIITNMSLPVYCGIGKGSSIGFGTIGAPGRS